MEGGNHFTNIPLQAAHMEAIYYPSVGKARQKGDDNA